MPVFEIKNRDLMHYVEIRLNNDSVRTESGVARYWRGNIDMRNPMPSVGSMIKSKITGNKVFRPVFSGTGTVMLLPRFHEFIQIELDDEKYVLEKGAYWASDMDVKVDVFTNKLSAGLFSGEGFLQTAVSGSGTMIACSPGPVEIVDLKNDRLVLDNAYAVARSAGLSYTVQQSSKSLFGTLSSGEALVQVIEGTGRVYLSAVPNHSVALQEVLVGGMMNALSSLKPQR